MPRLLIAFGTRQFGGERQDRLDRLADEARKLGAASLIEGLWQLDTERGCKEIADALSGSVRDDDWLAVVEAADVEMRGMRQGGILQATAPALS